MKMKSISNLAKYKSEINKLIKSGEVILKKLKSNKSLSHLRQSYEIWYSESLSIIKIVLPDRAFDFSKMHYDDKTRSGLKSNFHYSSSDWELSTLREVDKAKSFFDSQIGILKSCKRRFESSLFDIRQLLQADMFESELDAARELSKKGFTRAAGAVAGVVLEGHLGQVCSNHSIAVKKNNPTINDLNQLLKDNNIIEIPTWRFIQHLGDLRNICDHKKQKEPTKDEIDELIEGVDKVSKTLY